jgi:hypothetical protein
MRLVVPLCLLALAACSSGAPGGTDLGAGDGICLPDPSDCAGRCDLVFDRCGIAVDCGSCSGGGGDGSGGDGSGGDGSGGDGSGGAGGDTNDVKCSAPTDSQCACFNGSTQSGSQSCDASQFSNGICCATANYPAAAGSGCFCESWGCSASNTDEGGCTCGLGTWAATSCTPGAGALCCAGQDAPDCTCTVGLAACPSGTLPVSQCDSGTFQCSAGYPYPITLSSCN